MARLEFDEHIDITVRLEIVPQDRAEQRQSLDVVPARKMTPGPWDHLHMRAHGPNDYRCRPALAILLSETRAVGAAWSRMPRCAWSRRLIQQETNNARAATAAPADAAHAARRRSRRASPVFTRQVL